MRDARLNKKLDHIRALAEEHFDDFLVVGTKDGEVYDTYSSAITARGMCRLVALDIDRFWSRWSDSRGGEEDLQGT